MPELFVARDHVDRELEKLRREISELRGELKLHLETLGAGVIIVEMLTDSDFEIPEEEVPQGEAKLQETCAQNFDSVRG